jgi:maltose alpha-D-glucosyltransferase/alpha-amylase
MVTVTETAGLTQNWITQRPRGGLIWLMPIYPSPLKDDGYDIADFYNIAETFGTVEDFKALIDAAHQRNIRVIMDLVLNHTSDQHPWFQASRADRNSPYRDYYVWSDTDQKYTDARIIFIDTQSSNWTWDEKAGQYYWHRFYPSQPDLNYDNPRVQEEMLKVASFWLDLGIDGFRADAVPYLFEREGTNGENLAETHAYLKKLRTFLVKLSPNSMCGQSMAGRCPSLLWRWRRVSHGISLSDHAAHLYGHQKRQRAGYG